MKSKRVFVAILVVLVAALLALPSCFGKKAATDNQSQEQPAPQANTVWRSADERLAISDSTNDVLPGRRVVYLTFDDGPSTNTPRILEILNKYGACATWFIKGDQAQIAYTKEIWDAGNQLAIHTFCHRYGDIYSSTDAYWEDVELAGQAIKDQVGFAPRLVRFPGGSVNGYNESIRSQLVDGMSQRGYHYFDWNVHNGDGGTVSAEEAYNYVVGFAQDCNSCCVLMHDSVAKDSTVEALPSIIEWFIENGFEFDVLVADSFGYHF